MLEKVQERATKSVDSMKHLDYAERLQKLELPTLQFRRQRGDMIQVWKHFNSYDQATLSPSFRPITRVTRKQPFQLTRNRPKDGARGVQSNSFYYLIASSWNELEQNVVEAPTINCFKARIDVAWNDKTNKFTITEQSEEENEELFGEIWFRVCEQKYIIIIINDIDLETPAIIGRNEIK